MRSYIPGSYYTMRVCRKGHTITRNAENSTDDSKFCGTCGAQIIDKCPACSTRLRGEATLMDTGMPGFNLSGGQPYDFCLQCGSPLPWTPKNKMIGKIREALEDANIEAAEKVNLKELLNKFEENSLDEAQQKNLFKHIKEKAPSVWDFSKPILQDILGEGIKAFLGLK